MATHFRSLIPYIYHEKQQQGSMLCAQHALNSLLQGNYYTAPDLSDLARNLDVLEETHRYENTANDSSNNMDDTGFFSIQVIENALKVWGLNLVRWRSEEMRPYQNHPETQLGFILNLEQHWFTLRRFGHAEPKMDDDEGNGHWFNLNSFLPMPEWVGKEYLKMVLQQSETEGYSVFVITQADPEAPLALPRTQADDIASTMSEPNSTQNVHADSTDVMDVDLGDEDYELQAALQASMMGNASVAETPDTPEVSHPSPPRFPGIFASEPVSSTDTPRVDDPVQASMERSRLLLERMKREQEYAQREMWSDTNLSPEEAAALRERRERRRQQEEEEERELRLAIEASERLAVDGTPPPATDAIPSHHEENDPELQAALRASLQSVHKDPSENSSTHSTTETDSSSEDETSEMQPKATPTTSSAKRPSEAEVSVDEMRRKRLERFGM